MHLTILWVCLSIAVVVFGVMLYSIAAFHKPPDAAPSSFRHNKLAELAWAIVPIAILIGMAVPAVKALVLLEETRQSALCRSAEDPDQMSKNAFHSGVRSL